MPTAEEITRHTDPDPRENPWVLGPPGPEAIEVVDYDPDWPRRYADLAQQIRAVLGEEVLELHHAGSTAVPGLDAKDIIDIDLVVADRHRYAAAKRAAVTGGVL